jgi:GNAT superfamily N-acetyltransferase
MGYPCSAEETRKYFHNLDQDPEHVILIAGSEDHGCSGWAHVFITKRLFMHSFAELGGLVVKEGFQGRGIGKALLAAAENWARHQDCREMRIRSNIIRKQAHIFYLSQAYRQNKQQRIFVKSL